MKDHELLRIHQKRVARLAASASATRNQGSSGIVKAGRDFFGDLDCRRLAVPTAQRYSASLERVTQELMSALPREGRSWGLARKLLNIFLRDVLYHAYLRSPMGLAKAETFMEVPLDSISAERIKRAFPRQLSPWPGVRLLTPDYSVLLQGKASELAARNGIARVHLDAMWWGAREPQKLSVRRSRAHRDLCKPDQRGSL